MSSENQELLRIWAEESLDISSDQPSNELRNELLTQVARDDFIPDAGTRVALHCFLENEPFPTLDELPPFEREALADSMEIRLNEFTEDILDLAPDTRRAQWDELRSATVGFSSLIVRAEKLKPFLDLPEGFADQGPGRRQLLSFLAKNAAALPADRARNRAQFLLSLGEDWGDLRQAAASIIDDYRQISEIDYFLVDQAEIGRRTPAECMVEKPFIQESLHQIEAQQSMTQRYQTEERKSQTGGVGGLIGLIWIVVVVLGALARGCMNDTRPYTTPGQQNYPEIDEDLQKYLDELINERRSDDRSNDDPDLRDLKKLLDEPRENGR